MQKHTPIGYCIRNGKAEIDPDSAKLVQKIFKDYLGGISMCRIAKIFAEQGIRNTNYRLLGNHSSIGKILENRTYLGDDFYPSLIAVDIFNQVQTKRQQKLKELGKTHQPSSSENQSWSSLLVCGQCGEPYRKYARKGKATQWKCKHYIYENHVCCRNIFLAEQQLEQAFIRAINQVINDAGDANYLKEGSLKKPITEGIAERKLTAQISTMLGEPYCDAQSIKQLAFQRAREQYQKAYIDDQDFQTQKLKNILHPLPVQTIFDETLMQQTIEKIVVQKDGRLQFYLKNHRMVETFAKEET